MRKLIKPFLLSSYLWTLSLGLSPSSEAQHFDCQASHLGSKGTKDFIAEFRPYLNRFEEEFSRYNTQYKTNDQLSISAGVLEKAIDVYLRFYKTYCDWPQSAPKLEIQEFLRMNAYIGAESRNRLIKGHIPQDKIAFWEDRVQTYIRNFWSLKNIHEKHYPDIVEARDVQGLTKICPAPCSSYSSGMARPTPVPSTPSQTPTAASFIAEGDDYYQKKMYSSAIGSYTKALEIEPESQTYLARGQAHYKLGLYDLAIDDFSNAVRKSPRGDSRFYVYLWWKGGAYFWKGDYNSALFDYTAVILLLDNTNQDLPAVYDQRSRCYMNLGKYNEAINDSSMAISLRPSEGAYYDRRAAAYYNLSSYTQAETDANTAIKLSPQLSNPYNTLGSIDYNKGYYYSSIDKYTNAIKINPENGKYYFNRGNAYTKINQCSAANQDFRKACDLGVSSACSANCN